MYANNGHGHKTHVQSADSIVVIKRSQEREYDDLTPILVSSRVP